MSPCLFPRTVELVSSFLQVNLLQPPSVAFSTHPTFLLVVFGPADLYSPQVAFFSLIQIVSADYVQLEHTFSWRSSSSYIPLICSTGPQAIASKQFFDPFSPVYLFCSVFSYLIFFHTLLVPLRLDYLNTELPITFSHF